MSARLWFFAALLAVGASAARAEAPAFDLTPYKFGVLKKLEVAKEPPSMATLAFLRPDGSGVDVGAFKGEVLLVNFWATWCAPCLKELPSIDRLVGKLEAEGVKKARVIALNVDRGDGEKAKKWLADKGLKRLAFYRDPTFAAPRRAKLVGMPTTLIIGPQGRELARYTGDTEWDAAEVVAMLRDAAKAAEAAN